MTDLDKKALLPCPFCGSTDIDPRGWASENSAGPACDDCGAAAGSVAGGLQGNIEAWNRRAVATAAGNAARTERLLGVAMQTLEQIATTPRNRGARRNANGTLRFIQTQMQPSKGEGE